MRACRPAPERAGLLPAVLIAAAIVEGCVPARAPVAEAAACPPAASWVEPGTARRIDHAALLGRLAGKPVVLLGEAHGIAAHHRWELSTIAALHGRRPDMVLGFEAFPRKTQPALDRWVKGELDPAAFLKAVDWPAIWGYPADQYMPMFAFARQHRVPMVALNVDRTLVRRVAKEGWDAIPPEDRAGLGDPAPPVPAYRRSLAREYLRHRRRRDRAADHPTDSNGPIGREEPAEAGDAAIDKILEEPGFRRFVEAQLTWDRAMAEVLAAARRRPGAPLVVGVMGQGHVVNRYGVPHQLSALGVFGTATLLPRDREAACEAGLPAGLADAVFLLGPEPETVVPRPRLGVRLELAAGRVRVAEVMSGSVAAAAGLRAGDIIVTAAGRPVGRPADLVAIIGRQAPGTWLPLRVERKGRPRPIVAKFP